MISPLHRSSREVARFVQARVALSTDRARRSDSEWDSTPLPMEAVVCSCCGTEVWDVEALHSADGMICVPCDEDRVRAEVDASIARHEIIALATGAATLLAFVVTPIVLFYAVI